MKCDTFSKPQSYAISETVLLGGIAAALSYFVGDVLRAWVS